MTFEENFQSIARNLTSLNPVSPVTVREFLSWFNAKRRGNEIVRWIRSALEKAALTTEPDFESAFIDSELVFKLAETVDTKAPRPESSTIAGAADPAPSNAAIVHAQESDPTYRVSKLRAANTRPVSVAPNATLVEAVTIMLTNDFSQLPVLSNEHTVKGVITWQTIGTRLALGKSASLVKDLMDAPQEVRANSSIFQAIPVIAEHQYALVRGPDNKIAGILTSTDLNIQFQQLAEPFLQLGEIESQIRQLLTSKLSTDELQQARDPGDQKRIVKGVSDLSFGEYVRIVQNSPLWAKLALPIDQKIFCIKLDEVRIIRNDVMHFDPDGIPSEDLEHLREFARFLQLLQSVGLT
jgi:CBS domain-containing protein